MSTPELWTRLQPLTAARIGLPRSGAALATSAVLDLRLAHARARDAVHTVLDTDALQAALGEPVLAGASAAATRRNYLMRPDLGRQLDPEFQTRLATQAGDFDLALVVADGLSALAAQRHATPVWAALRPLLAGWSLAPAVLLRHGRVAAGDRVAQALHARAVLVLIGERPGLSSPDSLGAYLTWAPRPGTHDAQRNCISNIRPEGLAPEAAARKIAWLLQAMRQAGHSGVTLKDDGDRERLADDA
jgi:ethanolamine ammonia-lyase small subunit